MITITKKQIDHVLHAHELIMDIANNADDTKRYTDIAKSLKQISHKAIADNIGSSKQMRDIKRMSGK